MNQGQSNPLDIVIPFHAGDQSSTATLLELLLAVEDGHPTRYHLLFGDDERTLQIRNVIARLSAAREAELIIGMPSVPFPEHLAADDPNQLEYEGTRAKRNPDQKRRIFYWNANVFDCIQRYDRFFILEPDCVVLRQHWAKDLHLVWSKRNPAVPFVGHLKCGQIEGRKTPTHFAGCSMYDGRMLRTFGLERWFVQRMPNPWWPLRNIPGTTNANNAFYGPAWSGYDVSYDYFLFAQWLLETTGSDDPRCWALESIESQEDVIYCDFRSKLSVSEVMDRHLGRLSVLHGVKDDAVRHEALTRASNGQMAARSDAVAAV